MTLAMGSKGSRGWRSLGKPCRSCDCRGEETLVSFSCSYRVTRVTSPKLTWQQDEEVLSGP